MEYKTFIEKLLKEASKIAVDYHGKVVGEVKSDDNNQVLTQADLDIGSFIVGEVRKIYPDHNIIDEEAGVINNNSDFTWVIDPIDGTSNFASGLPMYGIMIGLLKLGEVVAGGIALPSFQEIYYAEKGQGAFCNDDRIQVTSETKLSNILLAYGIDGQSKEPDKTMQEAQTVGRLVLSIRNLRSSFCAFDAMMTARGRYGAFVYDNARIWDVVTQQIIIEEAGGFCTSYLGRPNGFAEPLKKVDLKYGLCAAPKILHDQIQTIIHKNDHT